MQKTGKQVEDKATSRSYRRLDLQSALEHVIGNVKTTPVP
jgi:hypothetical protein